MPSAVIIAQKRLERDEKIKEFLKKHQQEIDSVLLDTKVIFEKIEEISKLLLKKETSAKTVMLFYCQAAIQAQNKTNCLTEVMFEEAMKMAEEQDNFLAKEGKLIGPFHGIPFSIKDTFDMEDLGKSEPNDTSINIFFFLFFRLHNWVSKELQ